MKRTVFLAALVATITCASAAERPKAGPGPDGKWPRHSMDRPRPKVVEPQYDGAPEYWDVSYDYRGVEHWVRMEYPPGATIAVNRNGEPRQ